MTLQWHTKSFKVNVLKLTQLAKMLKLFVAIVTAIGQSNVTVFTKVSVTHLDAIHRFEDGFLPDVCSSSTLPEWFEGFSCQDSNTHNPTNDAPKTCNRRKVVIWDWWVGHSDCWYALYTSIARRRKKSKQFRTLLPYKHLKVCLFKFHNRTKTCSCRYNSFDGRSRSTGKLCISSSSMKTTVLVVLVVCGDLIIDE